MWQERLWVKSKKLRLAGISTLEKANQFLSESYLPKTNAKFSRPAAEAADAHMPLGNVDLADIMCREYRRLRLLKQPAWKERTTLIMGTPPRTVSNDYVVRFECRHFQILKSNKNLPHPEDKVTVLLYYANIKAFSKKPLYTNADLEIIKQMSRGGRRRVETPSPGALYAREYRARKKAAAASGQGFADKRRKEGGEGGNFTQKD